MHSVILVHRSEYSPPHEYEKFLKLKAGIPACAGMTVTGVSIALKLIRRIGFNIDGKRLEKIYLFKPLCVETANASKELAKYVSRLQAAVC